MVEAFLRDEFEKVEKCDELDEIGCSISMPNEYDPFHWEAVFIGPTTSAYHGGFFRMNIKFPKNYPQSKPDVYFTTKIFHPNVKNDGYICVKSLNEWVKDRSMIEVLMSIYILLINPNPNNPYNSDAAELYKNNKNEYNKKVNEYVRKYALIK